MIDVTILMLQNGVAFQQLSGANGVEDAQPSGGVRALAPDLHWHGIKTAEQQVPAAENSSITFDMDGMDSSIVPAVIAPSFGGRTSFESLSF